MAEWRPLHQSVYIGSGLETGSQSYDPPLLPYEKTLVNALGCSEEEYKKFVRYAMQKAHVRPAEYAHIPDIQAILQAGPIGAGLAASTGLAGPTATVAGGAAAKSTGAIIATNLAIGLALTAVSVLLAPKDPKIKRKQLADQIGPTRFNQSTNFDNVASLAELNQPIPIPFGKKGTGADDELTGGLILAPALVWSRLYAYGAYQGYEGVYVAGEFGVDTPDLGGILIGTSALSSLSDRDFALYWSSEEDNNRPASPPGYGTDGTDEATKDSVATGTVGRRIFTAPTKNGQFSDGFSMTYTPSGDTAFGTSTPIHNGTAYRFNWQVVSATDAAMKNSDARPEVRGLRRKIAGFDAGSINRDRKPEQQGMPGVGRAYSRHMGIISHNGNENSGNKRPNTSQSAVTVAVGDTVRFEIDNRDGVWEDLTEANFGGTEVNLKDLISSAKSWRTRASDLLALGTKWIIGASSWVVKAREGSDLEDGVLYVDLECVEIYGVPEIGIAGRRTVEEPLGGYDGDQFAPLKHCGAAFYTLCREHVATIRPVRRDTEVIELGIQSQVWNRASGLCNFNAIPSPAKLSQLDDDDVTVSTPRMDKYFKRSSCFSIFVRPVKEHGQAENEWKRLQKVFCVQGSAPITQTNYLRIRPETPGYYEYKLVPRTGSDIAINSVDSNFVTLLDAAEGVAYKDTGFGEDLDSGKYGKFRVTVQGRQVSVESLRTNEELFTNPSKTVRDILQGSLPSSIEALSYVSDTGNVFLVKHAWLTEFLGPADENRNTTKSVEHQEVKGDKSITIKIQATSVFGTKNVDVGQKYIDANFGSKYYWSVVYTVVTATGDWSPQETFSITKDISLGNRFRRGAALEGPEYRKVTARFVVQSVTESYTGQLRTGDRVFEQNSQIADCSHYTELTKSNESGPEHTVVFVNEYISNESLPKYDGMSTIGLAIKSTGQITSLNQLRLYSDEGIPVERLIEGDNKPSNLFADLVYYLLSNKTQGVGNIVPSELIDEDSLRTTARFLRANRIFFDTVVEDSESFRSFLYDNAPLQLCTFTIKNGRFGMQPALPFNSNHEISLDPIQVEQIFTAGNIIENSLQLQYIDVAQRTNIRGLVTWRVTVQNDLPYQASVLVQWADLPVDQRAVTEEAFDLSDFCTNKEQALRTARFLMSSRRRVTKTVSFKTVPDALGVQPGSYIRVITEASTYSSAANGAITDAGTLVSITTIEDGTYEAVVYNPTTQEVSETQITIADNAVTDSTFNGTFFTLLSGSTDYSVYQIEQLSLEEDGLVSITAVEVPTDASGVSIVAKDVLTPANFTVLE